MVIQINNIQFKYILLTIMYLLSMTQFFISHEAIHGQVYKIHGCLDINYNIDYKGAYTICNEYKERSEDIKLQEKKLHSLNEIIGYYIPILITLVFSLILFYILQKDLSDKK